jgi:hypothetical protein
MAIDLTGGLDVSREYVFAQRPDNPEMRDSVSMWISDDRGELGLPRIGIEAVASNWETHLLQLNVAFPDGRVYRARESGKALPAVDADGRPTVLGAGPLAFRCVEPFRIWTATFRGTAVQTSTEALIAGQADESRAELEFHVAATMAVPPWIQGSLSWKRPGSRSCSPRERTSRSCWRPPAGGRASRGRQWCRRNRAGSR